MTRRPRIRELIVHDPDDARLVSRDALNLIDDLLLAIPRWEGLEAARSDYVRLVGRYEALHGCIECGIKAGHKLDCSRETER